jgi:hypothetical protein
MRLVAGIVLVFHGVTALLGRPPIGAALLHAVTTSVGLLLFVGLWTPIAGTLTAIFALRHLVSHPGDPWNCVMLGTLGAALALLGPGGWSVDSRLFGWKRIEPPTRKG